MTDNFEKKVASLMGSCGQYSTGRCLGSSMRPFPRPGFAGRPAGTWPAMDGGAYKRDGRSASFMRDKAGATNCRASWA